MEKTTRRTATTIMSSSCLANFHRIWKFEIWTIFILWISFVSH